MKEKKQNGKRITVDSLAGMMLEHFEHLEKKMDEGFANVPTKIEMNERFDKVEVRLDTLEKSVGGYERRLEKVEDDVRVIKTKVGIK